MLRLMPDNLLKRYRSVCHLAGPETCSRWGTRHWGAVGTSGKRCHRAIHTTVLEKDLCLYSATSDGPISSCPWEVLQEEWMSSHAYDTLLLISGDRTVSWALGLLMSPPEVEGTNSDATLSPEGAGF